MNPMQRDLLDMVYPVGRGFIDFTDTDYSTYLGFTWERELMGMFPLGANDTTHKIDETGGSENKTLSIANLPEHKHKYQRYNSYEANIDPTAGKGGREPYANLTEYETEPVGKGQAFSIMPPYKTVYYWKRVA